SMYPLIAQGTGAQWIPGTRQPDYTITPGEAAGQVRTADPDVIILCTPNNPTGTPPGLDVVEAVYEAARGIGIVDEAYQ
ncbi:aminotransferase class I/II-fold pyridoxal phosphate-dependent enzyme, partial [Halomonas sp. SIMBA_159]